MAFDWDFGSPAFSFNAPRTTTSSSSSANDDEDGDKLSSRELSELRLDQLLHADFALKQTRGNTVRSQLKFNTEYDKEDDDGGDDAAAAGNADGERKQLDAGNLVATVLKEARIEHLSAGFGQDTKLGAGATGAAAKGGKAEAAGDSAPATAGAAATKSSDATIARLSRELAAQAFTAGSYQNLLNRRALLLASLQRAFIVEYRASKVSVTRKKKLGDEKGADLLTKTAVQSGLHVLLRFLTESTNQVKIEILDYLKARISGVPAAAFKTPDSDPNSAAAAAASAASSGGFGQTFPAGGSSSGNSAASNSGISPEISAEAFATMHRFLYQLAMEPSTSGDVRERCIECILGMAVACSSLPFFLSVVKLLMFPAGQTPISHVSVLPLLHKLQSMRDEVYMQQPSENNHETKMAVTELSTALSITVASDGRYLYTHSRAGLFKIGTGKAGSTHGMVYSAIRGFRGHERSTLACFGPYLYYRSPQIAPAVFLVLSTEHLLEVGQVFLNGKGTFASVDLSGVSTGLAMEDVKAKKSAAKKPATADAAADDKPAAPIEKDEKDQKTPTAGAAGASDSKGGANAQDDEKALLKKKQMQAAGSGDKEKDAIALKKAQHESGGKSDDKQKDGKGEKEKDPSEPSAVAEQKSKAPHDPAAMNLGDLKTDSKSSDSSAAGGDEKKATADDATNPMAAVGAAPAGDAPLTAAEEAAKKLAAEKAKRPLTRFTPVLSDGRFVYVVVPEPAESKKDPSKPETKSEAAKKAKNDKIQLNIHALDPKAKLESVHAVKLRQAPPRASSVLGCGTAASGAPQVDQYGVYKSSKQCPLASVNFGSPSHLNFDGSFTCEAWVKIPKESWNKLTYHGIFYKGDSAYRFYCFVQRGSIHTGINTRGGASASAAANCTIPDDEWFHIAVSGDMSNQNWYIYVNGNQVGTGRGVAGMNANGSDWVIGSSKTYPAFIYASEVRIWKRALTESQLKSGMKAPVAADADGLLGYWPLADGFGLSARDYSSFGHNGTLSMGCVWVDSPRPWKNDAKQAELKALNGTPEQAPYLFTPKALRDATVYTNGESLAILYPASSVANGFPGVTTAVFQVFSLDDGSLLQEDEHTYATTALAGTLSPTSDELYLFEHAKGTSIIHKYAVAPPAPKSKWRVARMKLDKDENEGADGFPTPRMLAESYPLPNMIDAKIAAVAASRQDLEDEFEDDVDAVSAQTTVVQILNRIHEDAAHLNKVNTLSIPGSLAHQLAVDLSADTFVALLELAEQLSKSYFATITPAEAAKITANAIARSKDPAFPKSAAEQATELQLYTFLVVLRLLRINIAHLVGWNADVDECGFNNVHDAKGASDAKRAAGDSKTPAAVRRRRKLGAGKASTHSLQRRTVNMRQRYVDLLNSLIVTVPTHPTSKIVQERVCTEVADSLSVGMKIWYTAPLARAGVLCELVSEALADKATPLRLLLLDRFFDSQSKPNTVVTLLPAIAHLKSKKPNSDAKVRAKDEQMSKLLENAMTLLIKSARAAIASKLAGTAPANDKDNVEEFSSSLREFLARSQICLLTPRKAPVASAAGAAQLARDNEKKERELKDAKTEKDGKSSDSKDSKDSKAVVAVDAKAKSAADEEADDENGSEKDLDIEFALNHALAAITACQSLLSETSAKLAPGKAAGPVVAVVSTLLKATIGAVLMPLMSGLWSVELDIARAARLLPALQKLLVCLDQLARAMPDVLKEEESALKGKTQRLVISRTSAVESEHPVPQGNTEKKLSIPGVREMTLEIDPRTFKDSSPGCTLTLYRRAAQRDPIEGGTFVAQPKGPIKVTGDSVYVVFAAAYPQPGQQNWGCKVIAKAVEEEERMDLPWILDLSKSVGLLAGKCTGVLLRGERTDKSEKSATVNHWLQSEMLCQGMEFDESLDAVESKELSTLNLGLLTALLPANDKATNPMAAASSPTAIPYLARTRSYAGVSIPELVANLAKRMAAAKVNPGFFPLPPEVTAVVDKAIHAIVGVVIKHNKLVAEAQKWVSSPAGTAPSASLVRAWKTPHKIKQYLLQKYQIKKAEKENENADRATIYAALCSEIMKRAEFLLQIVPVPSPDENAASHAADAPPVGGAPTLRRMRSSENGATPATPAPVAAAAPVEETKAADPDSKEPAGDKKATGAQMIAAWQSTRDTVKLSEANADDRFSILWKQVMSFVDESELVVDVLCKALSMRRRRTRLRCVGFTTLADLIRSTSLSSIRREVVASLVPALSWSDREAMVGIRPDIYSGTKPSGERLAKQVQDAFQSLYKVLVSILDSPATSGSHLLQSVIHAFSLNYTDADFGTVVQLGVYPALHRILLSDLDAQNKEKADSAPKKEREVKEKAGEKSVDSDKDKASLSSYTPAQTSAFALLDLMTTILSERSRQKGDSSASAAAADSKSKEPVYLILLSQLAKIAKDVADKHTTTAAKSTGFVPELPNTNAALRGSTSASDAADAEDALLTRKVGATSTFGLQTSSAQIGAGNTGVDMGEGDSDSFTIRVLKLVENIISLPEGCARLGGDGLQSLFTVFAFGSPRARIVVARILRTLFCSAEAPPKLSVVDARLRAAVGALPESKTDGSAAINYFLSQIGIAIAAPAFAALAISDSMSNAAVVARLQQFSIPQLHSTDGVAVWIEYAQLLRHLAAHSAAWQPVISAAVSTHLLDVPAVLSELKKNADGNDDAAYVTSTTQLPRLFTTFGALATYGGLIDAAPRVGSRVLLRTHDTTGTVVSRNYAQQKVSVIRDFEATVTEEKITDVVCLGSGTIEPAQLFPSVPANEVLAVLTRVVKAADATFEAKGRRLDDVEKEDAGESKEDGLVLPGDKKKKDEGANVSVTLSGVATASLQSLAVRVVQSLLVHPSRVVDLSSAANATVRNELFGALYAVATVTSPMPDAVVYSTSALEDRLLALQTELIRRGRVPAPIQVTVKADNPRLKVLKPEVAFDGEFTNTGEKVETGKSYSAPIKYLRLTDEPTAAELKGCVVLLDTYGEMEERLAKIAKTGALAVVLALHSENTKAEGLNVKEDADDKDETKTTGDVDVIAQAQRLAATARAAQAANSAEAEMALSSRHREFGRTAPRRVVAAAPGLGGDAAESKTAEAPVRLSAAAKKRRARAKAKEKDGKELDLVAIPTIAVSKHVAKVLRTLLGVKNHHQPDKLNLSILTAELVKKGYKADHASRALEKSDQDADRAVEWLKTNAEWLNDPSFKQTVATAAPGTAGSAKAAPTKSESELLDEDITDLEQTWKDFAKESDAASASGSSSDSQIEGTVLPSTIAGKFAERILSRSTYSIVLEAVRAQQFASIQYARRALVSLFVNWPGYTTATNGPDGAFAVSATPSPFTDKTVLIRTLHIALSLQALPAAELTPLPHANDRSQLLFRKQLLTALTRIPAIRELVMTDAISLLEASINSSKALAAAGGSTVKLAVATHSLPINSNFNTPQVARRLFCAGFSAMRLSFELDSMSVQNQYTGRVQLYEDSSATVLIRSLTVDRYGSGAEIVVPGNSVWYTVDSQNYYRGGQQMSITAYCKDVPNSNFSDKGVLKGDIGTALTLLDLLMRGGAPIPPSALLLLLRSLARAPTSAIANAAARIIIRLFNNEESLKAIRATVEAAKKHKAATAQAVVPAKAPAAADGKAPAAAAVPAVKEPEQVTSLRGMTTYLEGLERVHASLRTAILLNWDNGSLPGPHLQTLLELVLAGRKALGIDEEEEREDADGWTKVQNAPPPYLMDSYRNSRDGQATVSLINLSSRRILEDMTVISSSTNYGRELIIGDVVVRAGRWYFEVKLNSTPQFVAFGWISKNFRRYNAPNGLGMDREGTSWGVCGPSVQYYTNGVARQPSPLATAKTGSSAPFAHPPFQAGLVVGCLLDLENDEIQYTWNGKSSGIAFSGFNGKESGGMLPALITGATVQCTVNFGGSKFEYFPDAAAPVATALTEDDKKKPKAVVSNVGGGAVTQAFPSNSFGGFQSFNSFGGGFDMPPQSFNFGGGGGFGFGQPAPMGPSNPTPVAAANKDAKKEVKPAKSRKHNIFENAAHAVQVQPDGFCPLQDSRIRDSLWLARYRHSSDVTRMIYAGKPLPENVLTRALEKEVQLTKAEMRYEVAKTSSTAVGVTNLPENMLSEDVNQYYEPVEKANFHCTFNAAGKDVDVILQEVRIRCSARNRGITGLVFVSDRLPDFDSFAYCDNWGESNYTQFVDRKRLQRSPFLSHEPVAFFNSQNNAARVKLDTPRRGRFITLKMSSVQRVPLCIENISFTSIPGSHPLGPLLGSPLLSTRAKEMRDELLKTLKTTDWDTVWSRELDEQLVNLVQTVCTKIGVAPSSLDTIMLQPAAEDLMRFKNLEKLLDDKKVDLNMLRGRFAIVKYLNQLVTPLLEYVDIKLYEKESAAEKKVNTMKASDTTVRTVGVQKELGWDDQSFDKDSLSYIMNQLKGLLFMNTKRSVFNALLASGVSGGSSAGAGPFGSNRLNVRITVNRIKASRARENPAKDPQGEKSIFGQVYAQLSKQKYDMFRCKKGTQLFSVAFLGEGSIDAGGPYRECWSNIAADLMSSATPLFIQSPNGRNGVGLNREKYVINPSSTSSLHLSMYEFVGALMGMALRTGDSLNIDLGASVWKQVLGEKVTIADLESVDKLCVSALTHLSTMNKTQFETTMMEKWTTVLSNGKEAEVKPGGGKQSVTFENRNEFIDLSIQTRLHEADTAIRAIKKGLNAVVPANMLSLFSWNDLELLVCGNPEIDLTALRKHTVYQHCNANSPMIKNMWKCLESFTTTERQAFIRFVWGRSRLPLSDGDWTTNFQVSMLPTTNDEKLPISHTCFFSLELPNYSTYKVMRKKVLFAILNTQAIDIDFNPNASALSAWVEE